MRPRSRRVVAIVVVLALVAGTLCGAFLLSTTSHNDLGTLRSAATATLDAPSYRITARVRGEAAGFEEYVAPDRIRTRFTRLVAVGSKQFSPPLELIDIGTTSYAQQYCPPDGEDIAWSRSQLADPEHATPYARYVTSLIESATDARLVSDRAKGATYEFTPIAFAPTDGPRVEVGAARATIAHGRLAEVRLTQRVSGIGDPRSSHTVLRFSRYGTVRPITAPDGSTVHGLTCTGATALSAAP